MVAEHGLVDEMQNAGLMSSTAGSLTFTANHAELCKMDRERLSGKAGAQITYHLKGHPRALRIYSFVEQLGGVFDLAWAGNGHSFTKLESNEQSFAGAIDEPATLLPVLVSVSKIPAAAHDVSIAWRLPAEIGRIEVDFAP